MRDKTLRSVLLFPVFVAFGAFLGFVIPLMLAEGYVIEAHGSIIYAGLGLIIGTIVGVIVGIFHFRRARRTPNEEL